MRANSSKFKLTDQVDVKILQKIQDDFATAMDLSCVIRDLSANPITEPSNIHLLCHGLIRKTRKGDQRCRKSDKKCGQQAVQIRGPVVYICHAGLTDFAVPIEMDGRFIACMYGGHVLSEEPDFPTYRQKADAIAKEFGLDPEACLEALKKIPILSMDKIEAAARLMHRVVNTISDMADMANDKIRAQQQVEDWTASLHQIGLSLVSDLKLPHVLEKIAQSALNILNADVVLLYQYYNKEDRFDLPPVVAGEIRYPDVMQTQVYKDDVVARIVCTGESHYAHNAQKDKFLLGPWGTIVPAREGHPKRLRFPLREGIRSSAGVLLKVAGEVVGVMYVNYREPMRFTDSERLRIETFAYQAAIAINNARLFERTQRSLTHLETLDRIKESIDSALSFDDILQKTLIEGLRAVRTDEGSIMLVEPAIQGLAIKAWLIKGEFVPDKNHCKLALSKGIAGHVATTGKAHNCPDVSKDGHFVTSIKRKNIRSLLSVPIISHGNVLGVINTDSVMPHFFKEDDVKLLSALAGHVAVVIESQRLRDIGLDLSTLTVKEMLAKILENACFLTGTEASTIFIINEKSGELMREAGFHPSRSTEIGPRRKGGLTRHVINSGEPIIISDAQRDQRVRQSVKDQGVKSLMGVPLKIWRDHDGMTDVRTIGALFVNTTQQREFISRDVELLQSLASQASIAITKAELFERTKSDLDRRVEELSALAEIDEAITNSDLKTVLEKIVNTAVQLTGVDDVTICLAAGNGEYLVRMAQHGTPWKAGSPEKFPVGKLGVLGWVAEKKRTACIANVHSEKWKDIYVEVCPGIQSELTVPLLDKGNKLVGIINIESPKTSGFSEVDQRLMEALAKQAVIAINNQRRYEILEVIGEIDRAISSTLDLREVLSLILDKGLALVGASHGNIMLYDKTLRDLWMAVGRGTIPSKEGARQEVGAGILGLVAQRCQPLRVADVTEEPWRDIYVKYIEGTKSELAVPLLYKDKDKDILVGVLNAESPKKGDFSEDDQMFFEALANQAVIAIRNAALHQEVIDKAKALTNLHKVSKDISIALDFAQLSQFIADGATRLINADTARVYLYDGERFFSPTAKADGIPPSWMPKDQGLAARAVKSKKPVVVDDVESEELTGEVVKTEGIRSFICYPLVMGNSAVGTLYLNYYEPHSFTEDELKIIGLFTSHASIAIQNAERTQELKKAQERFKHLYEASQEIIQADLNERSILGAALQVGMKRTQAFSATARLLDESGKYLETVDRIGGTYNGAWKPIEVGVGMNGWVAKYRKMLLADVANMPEEIGTWKGHPDTKQKLVIPMEVGDDYFGNMGFDFGHEQLFKEDEVVLLSGIVTQTAAALQRLKQKKRAEDAERRQVAMDQLIMLHTLQTNLLHGFGANRLVTLREMVEGLQVELDKKFDQINQEIVYEILNVIKKSAHGSLEELKRIVQLPTKDILEKATLVDIGVQIQGAYRYTLDSIPESVKVAFFFAEDLPRKRIDPLQLSLIFENLFTNAYEVLKNWGGERWLTVTTYKAPDDEGSTKIGAKFSNTGPKIRDDIVRSLFRKPIGQGMGLYTSRWLLELYGGTISLTENEPGRVIFDVEFDMKGGQ